MRCDTRRPARHRTVRFSGRLEGVRVDPLVRGRRSGRRGRRAETARRRERSRKRFGRDPVLRPPPRRRDLLDHGRAVRGAPRCPKASAAQLAGEMDSITWLVPKPSGRAGLSGMVHARRPVRASPRAAAHVFGGDHPDGGEFPPRRSPRRMRTRLIVVCVGALMLARLVVVRWGHPNAGGGAARRFAGNEHDAGRHPLPRRRHSL